jgi:hypothetical protein
MNVFLTIDVECYTGDYEREVLGNGKGLAYLLARLREYETRATFFVEALAATRWGEEPLRRICRQIQDAGQEIQLHVHPVVANLPGFDGAGDVLWHHDRPTQERLISEGMQILKACGVPEILAFRAGDFAANEDTLHAMENLGIPLSSNRDLDFKCSTRSRINGLFPVRNDLSRAESVADLPLTVFRSPLALLDGPYRHLEISAVGLGELRDILVKTAEVGYACLTMLTHPAEFFRGAGGHVVPIQKNCRRLEGLLTFLRESKDVSVLTLSQCLAKTVFPPQSPPDTAPSVLHSLTRVCEQAAERMKKK